MQMQSSLARTCLCLISAIDLINVQVLKFCERCWHSLTTWMGPPIVFPQATFILLHMRSYFMYGKRSVEKKKHIECLGIVVCR